MPVFWSDALPCMPSSFFCISYSFDLGIMGQEGSLPVFWSDALPWMPSIMRTNKYTSFLKITPRSSVIPDSLCFPHPWNMPENWCTFSYSDANILLVNQVQQHDSSKLLQFQNYMFSDDRLMKLFFHQSNFFGLSLMKNSTKSVTNPAWVFTKPIYR